MPTAPRTRWERALRDAALAYPETHEDFPWPDHRAIKVRGKMFVILSHDGAGTSLSVKLPWSAEGALQMFRFCEPTGYGMGRSGWVTASFGPKDRPPLDVLRSFVDESYRAVAPKKLVAGLTGAPAKQTRTAKRRATRPRASPRKTAARR
jgi:predicted DNA-binding protein (MmcQ/YjbR family)